MHVEVVSRIEAFRDLRNAWISVYQRDPEAHFFLSWQWLAGPLEAYPGEWIVLVARDRDEEAVGFMPLRQKTLWSRSQGQLRNELHFAGRLFWADYGGFLSLPEYEEEVPRSFATFLQQMNWSQLHLKGFRASNQRYELFMTPFDDERLVIRDLPSTANSGATDNLVCPYIMLPETFDEYLETRLSRNTRQKVRRFLRRLDTDPDYSITVATEESRTRDVQILQALWTRMWSESKGPDTKRLAEKYATIVRRGLDDDLARLSVMWHGDKPRGALASFIDQEKSRLLFFVSGRDPDFDDLPVGLVLHAENIRWTIENQIRTYDLLRGDESYKYSLGATDVSVRYTLVQTASGRNLNQMLDPRCLEEAWRLARRYAQTNRQARAVIACRQILDAVPNHHGAKRLLRALDSQQLDGG